MGLGYSPSDGDIIQEYHDCKAWGLASSIDLYHCSHSIITDADAIKQFVHELCVLIDMKRFGDTQVVHFGEDEKVAGFSMSQLIYTSMISGHFVNATDAVYLDIFSCKPYDPQVAAEFAQQFFVADNYNLNYNFRL